MRQPGIVYAQNIDDSVQCGLSDGRWVRSRPLPYYSLRVWLRAVWLVATGRADALVWMGQ